MSRILLDMDGVVADLHTPWFGRYNRDYDDNVTSDQIKTFSVHPYVKPECGTRIYDYLNERGVFAEAPVIPRAVEGVEMLLDMGHEIFFCTTPPVHSQWAVLEKTQWVASRFPRIGGGNMIFTRHKHLVRADFLVDDYEDNLQLFDGHRILFDQPWNRGVDTQELSLHRSFDWRHLVTLIKRLS